MVLELAVKAEGASIITHNTRDFNDVLIDLCALSESSFQDLKDAGEILTPYATEFRYPSDIVGLERYEAQEALEILVQF